MLEIKLSLDEILEAINKQEALQEYREQTAVMITEIFREREDENKRNL